MENYFAFAETCIGESHLRHNTICQDSSLCVNNDKYALAAVADGHGSVQYLRTKIGSQLCVECALECIDEFLSSIDYAAEAMATEKQRTELFSQLWRSIVSLWHQRAEEHYNNNPFTEEELSLIPESLIRYRERYQRGDFLGAYGTTLIALAITEDFGFCIQIGDGTCVAVDKQGNICEPVPADENCYGCVTTSICQEDAVQSVRFCYFDKKSIPEAAFLGTDGVEDSYGDFELMHRFYAGLAGIFVSCGTDDGIKQLKEFLPRLTKEGNGDDVSVAGIINISGFAAEKESAVTADSCDEQL